MAGQKFGVGQGWNCRQALGAVAHFSGLPALWYGGEMVQLKGMEQVRQMDEPEEGNCSRTSYSITEGNNQVKYFLCFIMKDVSR